MKNNYFLYNLKGIARSLVPSAFLPRNRERILRDLDKREDLDYIKWRVEYYCRLSEAFSLDSNAWRLSDLRWTRKKTVYFFDSYEYAMYFPQDFRANFEFGDVDYVCGKPSITKSRPICKANSACSDFLGSASPHSLQRTASASHSLVSHNPKNSSTILEFAKENSPLTQDTRIADAFLSTSLASHSKFAKNSTSKTASRRLDKRSEVPNTRILGESMGDSAKDSNDSMESNAKSQSDFTQSSDFDLVDSHSKTCGLSRNDEQKAIPPKPTNCPPLMAILLMQILATKAILHSLHLPTLRY